MPEPEDLRELVRSLSPGALRLFRQQIASLPEEEKRRAFSRLSGIPEVADIVGRPTPERLITAPTQPEQRRTLPTTDIPLWKRALTTVGKPFEYIEKYVTTPLAALATAPFTPSVAGTAQLPWWQREIAEYKAAELPKVGLGFNLPQFMGGQEATLGVKGALEMLPWMALPGAGQVAGKLGQVARAGGTMAKAAGVAQKVVQPMAAAERIAAYPITKPLELVGKAARIPTAGKIIPEKGISPTTVTSAFPGGFTPSQQEATNTLLALVKSSKPITRETIAARRPEHAARAAEYERLLQEYRAQGIPTKEAEQQASAALAGRYPIAPLTPEFQKALADLGDKEKVLFDMVASAPLESGFQRKQLFTALQDLLLENRLQRNQIELLEYVFGGELAKNLLAKRPFWTKFGEFVVDMANAPRALLASCDISGLLRQGAVLFTRHPIEGTKTVAPSIRAMLSDKTALVMDDIIRTRPGMEELLDPSLKVILDLTAIPGKEAAVLTKFEESFASKIMNKLPFVRASNRAYVTVLNDMRSRSALSTLNSWKKAGIKYTFDDVSDLNQVVNWASGRGTLPEAIQKQGRLLNAFFFAPRLQFSRIQFPLAVTPWMTKSALVRQEAWRQLLSFVGAGASILTMAKLSGAADIELDPRSADFAKMKVRETRLDIWSGYSQYIRFMGQVASEQRKTVGGRLQKLNRGEVIKRFLQTKYSPAMGLINDILSGETFMGEEFPPKAAKSVLGQLRERMMPLAVQDMWDATLQDGPLGTIVSSVGLLGVGVVTYTDEASRAREKEAQERYKTSWAEVGRLYGRAAQLRLTQASPEIVEAEKEAEKRFATSPTEMQRWRKETQSIEDSYRESVKIAASEFRETGNGRVFREKVADASKHRQKSHADLSKRQEYQDIVNFYRQPLTVEQQARMNPSDIVRREYNQQMFSPEMFDKFEDYRFDEAERREQEFVKKYGQAALDYIDEYRGARWADKPPELVALEQAKDLLRPYWKIADQIWSMYPPELKVLADQIDDMEYTDLERAKQTLKQYPQILRARELITKYRKQLREANPTIMRAWRLYYG